MLTSPLTQLLHLLQSSPSPGQPSSGGPSKPVSIPHLSPFSLFLSYTLFITFQPHLTTSFDPTHRDHVTMSARSAIVRKKQKPPARSISAVRDPPASHWQGGPSPAQQQFRATTEGFAFAYEGGLLPPSLAAPRPVPPGLIQGHTYVPALNIIDLDFERSPPATAPSSSRDQTAFNQGQTGTSTSSCSSEKGHRSSSKIEKSVLRAYVDSKSDAFRNKLSFKALARKPSADHLNLNVRSTRGAHVPLRVITTPYTPPTISSPIELSRLSPQYQAAPVHSPTPFSVPELCSSGGRPRPSGSDRFGQHLSAVKRWIGEGKSPQPWSKIRKVC